MKRIVHYQPIRGTYIIVGQKARVFALDHPTEGHGEVTTTVVQDYDAISGQFVTRNNVYQAVGRDDSKVVDARKKVQESK